MLLAGSMRLLMLLSASVAAYGTSAFAQAPASAVPGVPGISCYMAPLKLSDADIVSFLGQANEDLSNFASAGLPLSTRVRMLAASDVRTLAPIIERVNLVAPVAAFTTAPVAGQTAAPVAGQNPAPAAADEITPAAADAAAPVAGTVPPAAAPGSVVPQTFSTEGGQMTAIAEGLAAAAIACSTSGNELGTIIQESVAKTANEPFILAFVTALENQNQRQQVTAALGVRGAVSAPAAAIGNDGLAGSESADGRDEPTPTVSGDFGVEWDARYVSDNGSGGSDVREISPTSP